MDLFLIFQIFVFHICIYLGNWGVEGAMCNILELLDQNPWRNNLSKLGTFDSILQRPHSAMMLHILVTVLEAKEAPHDILVLIFF